MPPPMPGSSGWITAENAHEFFDEDGNWIGGHSVGGGGLGGGAGRVRGRDEVEADAGVDPEEGEDIINGHSAGDAGDVEIKRPRTE